MVLSIDFDQTIVRSNFPEIIEILPNAKEVISYLSSRGHEIIIDSCRTGEAERQMRGFLKYNEIPFDWINKNSPRSIKKWGSDTRKISCDVQIDDKSIFLQHSMIFHGRESILNNLWYTVDNHMMYLEKPLIICIIGESGVGKTMVSDYFKYEYGVNMIESYTDRPRRTPHEKGHTFVSHNQMEKIMTRPMLAHTEFGGYSYCCLVDDIQSYNTYVIDEFGFKHLRDTYWEDYDIYSIRIHRDKDKRIESVGQERVGRDEGRFTMKDAEFDYVIHNVTDNKQDVFDAVDSFVKEFRFEKRFEDYIPLIIDDGDTEKY